jgi:hypothetical protein
MIFLHIWILYRGGDNEGRQEALPALLHRQGQKGVAGPLLESAGQGEPLDPFIPGRPCPGLSLGRLLKVSVCPKSRPSTSCRRPSR